MAPITNNWKHRTWWWSRIRIGGHIKTLTWRSLGIFSVGPPVRESQLQLHFTVRRRQSGCPSCFWASTSIT